MSSEEAMLNMCCAESAFESFEVPEEYAPDIAKWRTGVADELIQPVLETSRKLRQGVTQRAEQNLQKAVKSLNEVSVMQASWRAGVPASAPLAALATKAKSTVCKKEVVTVLKDRLDAVTKDLLRWCGVGPAEALCHLSH